MTLEELNDAAIRLLVPLKPEEVYEAIVKEGLTLLGGEYGSILLEQKGELRRVYSSSQIAYKTIPRKKGNTYTAFKTQRVVVADISDTGKAHPELVENGIKATVFIPLSYHWEKSVGVLTINCRRKIKGSGDALKILRLFGTTATLAIKKTQMYQDLSDAFETRDLFISLASHELRTPLTSINGYIQLLYDRVGQGKRIEPRWIYDLYEENLRLTNIVKELLEVNRMKQGQFHFMLRECNILEIVQKAIKEFTNSFPKRKIVLREDKDFKKTPAIVIGDFDKLLQVMSVVLQNAAKFSSGDTPIEIYLFRRKHLVRLDVIDRGVGIREKDLPRIFDGFYKADGNQEGMGVGLLLAKHIVSYHRGSIIMSSKKRKGARITIKLPLTHYL